ncbi:MAG: aminotransferase class I/II-fold pyridoxal phosphate-dependent enzyme, partial [Desulfobacterales bacterium]|nr:aminotransferase class I/II-fold pyridoxal phosphate-dependent enzyme [Desulfobacterales bacterium]
ATVIEAVRQKADTYIYTNPLSVADCAAAGRAIEICDGPEGRQRLEHLRQMTARFRQGIAALGWQSIPGPHPIVPLLVRDTPRTRRLVHHLFEAGVLAVGLTFPVVPRGDETIRFQINAAHTASRHKAAESSNRGRKAAPTENAARNPAASPRKEGC